MMGIMFGTVMAVSGLVSFFGTKEDPRFIPHEKRLTLARSMKTALANKPFMAIAWVFVFAWVGVAFVQTSMMYYMKYCLFIEQWADYIFFLLYLASFAFIPLWVKVSDRYGKKPAFYAGMAVMVPCLVILSVLPESARMALVCAGLYGGHRGLVGQRHHDLDNPGRYRIRRAFRGHPAGGISLFADLFCLQGGGGIRDIPVRGCYLDLSGYVENVFPQADSALLAIRLLVGAVPVVMVLIAVWFMTTYPITKQMHEGIKSGIDQKRQDKSGRTRVKEPGRHEHRAGRSSLCYAGTVSFARTSISEIASAGHTGAQTPHPMHFSAVTMAVPSSMDSALKKQRSTQASQPVHVSASTTAANRLGARILTPALTKTGIVWQQSLQQLHMKFWRVELFMITWTSPASSHRAMSFLASSLVSSVPVPRSMAYSADRPTCTQTFSSCPHLPSMVRQVQSVTATRLVCVYDIHDVIDRLDLALGLDGLADRHDPGEGVFHELFDDPRVVEPLHVHVLLPELMVLLGRLRPEDSRVVELDDVLAHLEDDVSRPLRALNMSPLWKRSSSFFCTSSFFLPVFSASSSAVPGVDSISFASSSEAMKRKSSGMIFEPVVMIRSESCSNRSFSGGISVLPEGISGS